MSPNGVSTRLLNDLKRNLKRNGHNVIGIQGRPGWGKSTLALVIAMNLSDGFDPRNVFYDRKNCLKVIANAPKRGTFIMDEGGNIALSRTWQNRGQTEMMQILLTIRQRHHNLIWCMPNLNRADVIVREDLLTHKLNLIEQGTAKVRVPFLDRDGEFAGWKTWLGYLGWPSLDKHPIWIPYYTGKEAAYRAATKTAGKSAGRTADELAQMRSKVAVDPATGKFVKRPPAVEA